MTVRLGALDGLRGIAILQVLWYHVWLVGRFQVPWAWLQFVPATGLFGVHLFFFLSGFVIVYPYVRANASAEPEPTWAHFAWRRFVKIVPSYAISIAIAYATGFFLIEQTHATVFEDLITHALFIHTWFPQTAGTINGVLWTLAVEVQFYLLFPVVWWFFKRGPVATTAALAALGWISRSYGWHGVPASVTSALAINLPTYIDLFGFGMFSAWCFVRFGHRLRSGRLRFLMPAVALTGGVMFVITLIGFSRGQQLWHAVPLLQTREVLGIAFMALALGALCSPPMFGVVLSNPLLSFVALISYNLYLYNWIIAHELQHLHWTPPAFTVAAFALSIAFATLVTYLVERPLLRLPVPTLRSRRLDPVTRTEA
ncbi:MAG TPA: acyltransferase [Candidatus Aquilonibacter sp.]|nr:acyltransferase [Candidatus Aquilonibacter sp.]